MKAIFAGLYVLLFLVPSGFAAEERTLWVNSAKRDCTGVAPMSCLQVQEGEERGEQWSLFYSPIEGFEYVPGYLYKLRVEVEDLAPEEVPADGSSKRYTLVEIVEKKRDTRLRVNDIWMLETIAGEPIALSPGAERPRLEIQVAQNRVLGFAGCNTFGSVLERLGENEIVFGPLAATRKMCPDMTTETAFLAALGEVRAYAVRDGTLVLSDESGAPRLGFRKTD